MFTHSRRSFFALSYAILTIFALTTFMILAGCRPPQSSDSSHSGNASSDAPLPKLPSKAQKAFKMEQDAMAKKIARLNSKVDELNARGVKGLERKRLLDEEEKSADDDLRKTREQISSIMK